MPNCAVSASDNVTMLIPALANTSHAIRNWPGLFSRNTET
jgi:hypothetical protein